MYDADSARELLLSLRAEAVEALLFLKSIQRLELYEWRQGQASPSLLHACALSNASPETLSERRFFTRAALSPAGDEAAEASSYVATFESRGGAQQDAGERRAFLVRQACGGGASRSLAAQAAQAFNVQVVPYAAVAAALPDEAAAAGAEQQDNPLEGRAFCFLAITKTGLPVHVNGD